MGISAILPGRPDLPGNVVRFSQDRLVASAVPTILCVSLVTLFEICAC